MKRAVKQTIKQTIRVSIIFFCMPFAFFVTLFSFRYTADARPNQKRVTVTISAVGDCTLGYDEREQYTNSFADVYNRQTPAYFFENVASIFAADDLTIANCEGVLADAEVAGVPDDKTYIHRGDGVYAEIFKLGNVDVANLANNHTLDFFQAGFNETRRNLALYGVGYFGRGPVYTAEINGITVGCLGYSGYTNGYKATAQKEIQKMREEGVQLIIVSFHWGDDKAHYPNALQFELGRAAIDYGADLVLGHHPHVIQGIELYKGKYIVYSLGNFCYGGSKNPADKDTFIFRQSFTFVDGTLSARKAIEIIPASISSITNRNDYRPTLLYADDAKRVYERLTAYSRPLGTEIPRPDTYINYLPEHTEEDNPTGSPPINHPPVSYITQNPAPKRNIPIEPAHRERIPLPWHGPGYIIRAVRC